jgi:hypothetical protein
MTEAELFQFLRSLPPGDWVRESTWLFGLGETFHFVGLSLLFGSMTIVDLRLMGFLRGISYSAALSFLPWALVGFFFLVVTGFEFITADPAMYLPNPAFRLKLIMIVLAGLNAIVFTVMEHKHVLRLADDADTTTMTKVMAGASLTMWVLVILLGRMLPTFEGSRDFF